MNDGQARPDFFKFYPADYRRSVAIQSLDHFSKGVYWELRCFLFSSKTRGILTENGAALSDDVVVRMLGLEPAVGQRTLDKILKAGVLQRHKLNGAIMDDEMFHAEEMRLVRVANGKRGGNPALRKEGFTPPEKPAVPIPPAPGADASHIDNGDHGDHGDLFPVGTIPVKASKKPAPPDPLEAAKLILRYLNEGADRNFRELPDTLRVIKKRLDSVKNDVPGVKVMIDRQIAMWKGDPRMEMYLRPETLFNIKFNGYYDDRNLPIPKLVRVQPHPRPAEQNQMQENIPIREVTL